MHSDQPELLYTRTYSCACATCREPSSVTIDNCSCPVASTVGRWRQQTIHSVVNVAAQRKVMLEGVKKFQESRTSAFVAQGLPRLEPN